MGETVNSPTLCSTAPRSTLKVKRSKTKSESRDEADIVTVETRSYKQTGEEVIRFEQTILIPKQDTDSE